ncbi:MAG: hypothetical protein U0169_03755 [Polyangiaceae bacterium]
MGKIHEIEREIDAQNRAFDDALRAMTDLEARCLNLARGPLEPLFEAFDGLELVATTAFAHARTAQVLAAGWSLRG